MTAPPHIPADAGDIPDRMILSLSLFDVPLPARGIGSFLDNTDSLWDALDHAGRILDIPVVQVFTIRQKLLQARTVHAYRGSTLFLFRAKRPLCNLAWLASLVRRSPVIMLNNESWSDLFSASVARLCGSRILMYYHNADKAGGGKLPAWALRLFRRHLVDAGATSSEGLRRLFSPSVAAPISILPFGVDTGAFAYGERQRAPVLRAVFCGRISREKKIEDILHGIACAAAREEISLTIIGEEQDPAGPYSTSLQQLARTLGVALTMAGHTPHSGLRQRLMDADVLINMRPDEGFGKVFIEAMATGLPVIGRRMAPGPSTIIGDGETGFLVDDPRDLGAVLDRLHTDPALRVRIGRAAHAAVLKSFTTQHALDAAETIFRRLLSDGRGAAMMSRDSTRD